MSIRASRGVDVTASCSVCPSSKCSETQSAPLDVDVSMLLASAVFVVVLLQGSRDDGSDAMPIRLR
jgi:hypothetical protein